MHNEGGIPMASIVHQTDKRSGITYAYSSDSKWDPEKKQSRAKRTLIGRVNKETGEIEPTDGRGKKRTATESPLINKEPETKVETARRFYGATYLFDAIGEKLGITKDLKQCFPDTYKQMLSIVYYLIMEDNNPLFRFEKWSYLHKHPYGKDISSQRSSELFASVTEEAKEKFFYLQGKRKIDEEYWAYDTTSISSYSEQLKHVAVGYNKEDDKLPQINLALVFGEKSNLPFYYRELAGNMPDSKTVKNLLVDLGIYGFSKVKLVMDRGFYSEKNVNALYQGHLKFLLAPKLSTKLVEDNLDKIYDDIHNFENYNEKYEQYSKTVSALWHYKQEHPRKGITDEDCRRIYIHYYYNLDKATENEKAFDRKLVVLRRELETDKRIPTHEAQYAKWFDIKETPKRGIRVAVKEDMVKQAKRYFGYFALISNQNLDSITSLEIYRNKDVVEKAFGNLKERLSMRRALVSSEESMNGKLFLTFVALIYLSYIKKQMQINDMFKKYTLQGVIDKLDVIECFEHPGMKLRIGELLEKQSELYTLLGVEPPSV
jgi:transposase